MVWLPALAHPFVLGKGRCGIHCDLGLLSPRGDSTEGTGWSRSWVAPILPGSAVALLNLLEPSSSWFFYTGYYALLFGLMKP